MEGMLRLFGPNGTEINASRKDLLKLEARDRSVNLHRRVFDNMPGSYWLLSARPGHVRMILEITLYHVDKKWSLSWCVNGIASYPHWNIDSALQTFLARETATGIKRDPHCPTRIPINVEKLAREHVRYVPGVKGLDDVRPQFALRTVSASEAKTRLAQVTTADTSELISQYAGRRVEIVELMLAVSMFCQENEGLAGKEMAVAQALTKQHLKLLFLSQLAGAQLAQG